MSTDLLERTEAGKGWNPRIAFALVLGLVFLCGAAAGGLAMNSGLHNRLHQPAFDTPAGKALNFETINLRVFMRDAC